MEHYPSVFFFAEDERKVQFLAVTHRVLDELKDSKLLHMSVLSCRAGGGAHIEPRYRQFPQLTRSQVIQAEFFSATMWFWILWRFWHDSDAVLVSAGEQSLSFGCGEGRSVNSLDCFSVYSLFFYLEVCCPYVYAGILLFQETLSSLTFSTQGCTRRCCVFYGCQLVAVSGRETTEANCLTFQAGQGVISRLSFILKCL